MKKTVFKHAKRLASAALSVLFAFLFISICGCGNIISGPDATDDPEAGRIPPPEDISVYEGLLFTKVFGSGGKADGVTASSFIEIYNSSEKDIALEGLSVYYKSSGYKQYYSHALSGAVRAGGFYLIKCGGSGKYDPSGEVIRLDSWDDEWDRKIDNKEIGLLLAPSGLVPDVSADPAELDGVVSYFFATDSYCFDTGVVKALSKNKYAVRTALKKDSGWQIVNLAKANSQKLRQIVPKYSGGNAGVLVKCLIDEVDFSMPPGYYDSEIEVSLTSNTGGKIYYTMDGSDPRTSGTRKEYDGPLLLKDSGRLGMGPTTKLVRSYMGSGYSAQDRHLPGGYTVKACSVTEQGEASDVFTASYFISPDFRSYGVTVMSISLDKEVLVGETGFYNNYYGSENIQNPRGMGMVEVFDENGLRRGYSNVEFSVSGHGSSGAPMKSLKMFYKNSNNETGGAEDKLYYDLFDGYAVNSKGQAITEFARLLLRNSGNDYSMSTIRDAYMQTVSRKLDVDIMAYAPALVFINGEFWGVYNVRERYSGDYVESHYGIDKDNVAVIESDYSQVHTDQNADFLVVSGVDYDADAFNDLVLFIRTHDLTDQKNFDYVAGKLDLTSFTDMYVARQFFNAVDWPENNIKVWRNRAGDADPSGFDTKWHFTLLDMDFGAGFYDFTDVNGSIMHTLYSVNCVVGSIMNELIKNEAFREEYIKRFYFAATQILTPEYLEAELDRIAGEKASVFFLQEGRWSFSRGEFDRNVEVMRSFAKNRSAVAVRCLCDTFGVKETSVMLKLYRIVTVSFSKYRASAVTINGGEVSDAWWSNFNDGDIFTVTVTPKKGWRVASISFEDTGGGVTTFENTEPAEFSAEFTMRKAGTFKIEFVRDKVRD